MKNFAEYINEFKSDMKPKTVILMGNGGQGKTFFMDNMLKDFMAANKLAIGDFKKLDVDNNLAKEEREHFIEIAKSIYKCTSKDEFDRYIDKEQNFIEAESIKGNSPINFDLHDIDWEWCVGNKDKSEREFVNLFLTKYDLMVANDFSWRSKAKKSYKEDLKLKIPASDCAICITGDDISKIEEICNLATPEHIVIIIYLHGDVSRSLAGESLRKRKGGSEMILRKEEGIKSTWAKLKKTHSDIGVYRMFELIDDAPEAKFPNWKLNKVFV